MLYYSITQTLTQLKSLAKTTEAVNAIKEVGYSLEGLESIGKSYTTEVLKAALAQSTLNKEQIKAVLYANGLRGEVLELTADEIFNAASTNMVANEQKKTTATTLGLGTAFEGLWIVIKKATVAMVKFLFTNPLGWATLAVTAIAGIVLGVKQYRENITKAAEESKEAINKITDSYEKLNSTVNDVKKKYAELAQGVNQFTGENKSLSNDEYAEFLDLSNKLAELFPSLSKRYDENGNAILNLSGDVNTIIDSLTNLVEVEKQLANKKIIDEIPNVLKGYNQNRSDLDNELKNLKQWYHDLEVAYESLQDINKVYETGFTNNNSGYLETLRVLSDLGIEFESIDYEEGFGYGTIALEDYDDSLDKISRSLKAASLDISKLNSKIKSENAEFNRYLSSWLFDDWSYVSLDSELQNIIQEMLFNTDWLSEAKSQGVNTKKWDKLSEWIEKNYISAIANINDDKVKSALIDIYSIPTDDQPLSEYVEQFKSALETIQTYCKENGVKIPIEISDNNAVDTFKRLQNSIRQITDDHGITDREQYAYLLNEIDFEHFTQEQVEFWLEATLGAQNATEAIQMYKDALAEAENADDDHISFSSVLSDESLSKFQSTIDSLKSSLTTLYNGNYSSTDLISSLSNINKVLSDIGKADVLNWEEITNIDDLDNVINQITNEYVDGMLESLDIAGTDFGNTIRNVIQEELKSSRQLETYKSNVSDLQTAYSDLTDVIETYNANGYITFDQLTSLLEMEPQYLSCLIDDNGQLQLNQESMLALANQRLNDAEAQAVQQAITELGQLALQDEKTAVEENAQAFSNAVSDLAVYNEGLAETIGEASVASSVIRDLNAAISGAESRGATDTEIDTVLTNLETKLQLIKNTRAGLSESFGNIMGGSSSASSATSDFSETIDFFERRVEVLDDALSHLKSTLDNVTGSFAKNNLIDAELGITEEEFRNYTDALSMYTQKANEAFSKIPADIASTVKDGAVSLTEFLGDSNKDVVEAIKEYESWADKIADCQKELAELKKEIRQLELDKFNNIMDDFQNQFDLRGDSKDLISKQIDLLKEAGELIGESFFTAQIDQSKKQLELLENEKAQLVHQMSSAISSGRIQQGTDEWLEMVNALSDVDSGILDCKKSIEVFDNEILNLHTEIFNRIQDQFSDLDSEISNIIDLFDDFEVSDDKGIWSKEAIAQLGLLSQQYELAQYRVQQYNDEIDKLNAQYLAGKYSATEYGDKLGELNSAQWDAVKSAESAKDALMDLNETRIENQIKGIEKEIDAYKELIDAQIEALSASKDLHDYENSISEKTKSITDLEHQIAAMQNDTSASTIAKRKKLEQELADAKADLEETEYQHSIEVQEDALNKQYENYQKNRNEEIDKLRESLNDKETILAESFNTVKNNASLVGQEIATVATQHGITVSKALVSSWQSGENAIAGYGEVLAPQTSAFVGNVKDIETEVYNLQEQADAAAGSMAGAFSAKADGLVDELTTSYGAASNLAIMTDALHTSLINTLQNGYDVSSLVKSLNAVTDAANSAKIAVDRLGNLPTTNVPQSTIQHGVTDGVNTLYSSSNIDDINKWLNNNKNIYSLGTVTTSASGSKTFKVKKYASGSSNIEEDQLAITNEAGQELIYHASDGSILTPLRQGDKVFDNESVNRLWQLGHGLVPPDILKNLAMPTVLPNNVNNTNNNPVQIGNLINVQGNVDSSNIKQMEAIANKAVDKLVNRLHDGLTYGR